jgi:threonine dehydrogenase-like Zn-dependent dehydrogenase
MKALIFDKRLELKDVPTPQPEQGEALIRVLYSAICNTDLEIIKGYMGFNGILGHEFVGEVVTKTSSFYGKRVVGEINCSCGNCYLCKTGRRTHCADRTVLGIFNHNGVFAEYVVLPEVNLHAVPENLPTKMAVFTEPLAAAVEIFDKIHIRPTQPAIIFGAGKLGLLISMVFRQNGCNYTTYDQNPAKVEKARLMGINAALLTNLQDQEKAEVCVDCTGHPDGITQAMNHLYPGGKLVLKTTVANAAKIDLNQIVINEFQIIGSRCGPFEPALKLLASGSLDTNSLISGIYNFDDLPEAFCEAANPDSLKILIRHGGNH